MELTIKFTCMNLKELTIWKEGKGFSTLKSFLIFCKYMQST